ncbi:putative serine/threonine-protein kinase [Sesbania bispinosa]|nr:putative serine/threonine-protein kinase [Sesbania bispinosa]
MAFVFHHKQHLLRLLLTLFVTLLPLPTIVAQTHRNITLGSSLTTLQNNSWTSPSGEFAFGFQQIEEDGFLLAIWFNKIQERTIVWYANGQNLVGKGSKVELTSEGQFWLKDPSGKVIWNPPNFNEVAHAALLDSGNLVLVDQDSVTIWQSFDYPTDTLLPGQILSKESPSPRLVSRYLESNFTNGRFQFSLQKDGNLVLYTQHFPQDNNNYAYWSTQVFAKSFRWVFNQSGYIFLEFSNGSTINMISSTGLSTKDFYQRAILDYDGVFRHYVYPKNTSSSKERWSNWTASSVTIPSNICLRIIGGMGGGACGYNSYCTYDGTKRCHCPRGYSFIDPNDVMKGCKQDFVPQSCDEPSLLFYMDDIPNADFPGADAEDFESVTEDWCRQACLNDCFCAAAIFKEGKCWPKRQPLSNGRIDTDFTAASRFGYWNSKVAESSQSQVITKLNLRSYTYEELSKATNGFNEELGHGAFAIVYKGVIPGVSENIVAVKKLDTKSRGIEEEFKAEVSTIGQTNHRNLVQLIGFCDEGQHRLLVYEFMSNGSLASFLFGAQKPRWYQRKEIALAIARGLFYLHDECRTQIIHCDIKPQNVLLDNNYTARISDFGLAKLLKLEQTRTTTGVRGTKGYVAPEWFRNVPVSVKVDVYSYGILLLEIICCKKNFEVNTDDMVILADWVYDSFKDGNVSVVVEDDKEAMEDMKRVERFVMTAIWCIQEDPSLRPTMKKVLLMLEGSVDVPIPPDPSSF